MSHRQSFDLLHTFLIIHSNTSPPDQPRANCSNAFLTDKLNNVAWYKQGIFPGQSPTIRKRGVDMTTYTFAIRVLAAARGVALWLVGKWLRSRRASPSAAHLRKIRSFRKTCSSFFGPWQRLSPVVFLFADSGYFRPFMLDLSPAFALAFVGLCFGAPA